MNDFTAPAGRETGPLKPRRRSVGVRVGNVTIGGDAPIAVQSMTNTD
ncbi:MAG: flavodoxin-dependent (E)-4-hydroxy-3-methylbut-2-enyl-diphosphate synthase, partial [Gammaproteobacteria bacterium]